MSATTTFHDWARLPTELKLEVLSCYLPATQYISEPEHRALLHRKELGTLIRTRNRELVTLGLDVYYGKYTFRVRIHDSLHSVTPGITYPPPAYGKLIRHLQVDMCSSPIGWNLDTSTLSKAQDWRWLFQPKAADLETPRDSPYVAWQRHFSNIGNLELLMSVWVPFCQLASETIFQACPVCGFDQKVLNRLETWLANVETKLSADEVVASIEMDDLLGWDDLCLCTEAVKGSLARMATRQT
jgi:hypothetical protein